MATQLVTVLWGRADERGPVGQVEGGGRKLVRLDRTVPAWQHAGSDTVQPCRVTRDTNPDDRGRGVLFVVPAGPAVSREEARKARATRDLQEVRAEFEAAWRAAARDGGESLQNAIHGYSPKGADAHDSRWGGFDDKPKNPRLRVHAGQAGVWTYVRNQGTGQFEFIDLLLPLPEVGQGEVLKRRLAENWEPTDFATAQKRLAELELEARDIRREATAPDAEGRVTVTWTASIAGIAVTLASGRFDGPLSAHMEAAFGDEEIPEVTAAYAAWAEKFLADTDDTLKSGVVSIRGDKSAKWEYESPDGGRRTAGGDNFWMVAVDGQEVGSVLTYFWPKAQELLGIVPGAHHPGLSARQLHAIGVAFHGDYFTCGKIGPRGEAAFLKAAEIDPARGAALKAKGDEEVRLAKEAAERQAEANRLQAERETREGREKAEAEREAAETARLRERYGALREEDLLMGMSAGGYKAYPKDTPLVRLVESHEKGEALLGKLRASAALLDMWPRRDCLQAVVRSFAKELGRPEASMSANASWRPDTVSAVAQTAGVEAFCLTLAATWKQHARKLAAAPPPPPAKSRW